MRERLSTATNLNNDQVVRLAKFAASGVELGEGRVSWGDESARAWLLLVSRTGLVSDYYSGTDNVGAARNTSVVKTSALIDIALRPAPYVWASVRCGRVCGENYCWRVAHIALHAPIGPRQPLLINLCRLLPCHHHLLLHRRLHHQLPALPLHRARLLLLVVALPPHLVLSFHRSSDTRHSVHHYRRRQQSGALPRGGRGADRGLRTCATTSEFLRPVASDATDRHSRSTHDTSQRLSAAVAQMSTTTLSPTAVTTATTTTTTKRRNEAGVR